MGVGDPASLVEAIALFALVIALLLSFVITKGLVNWRARLTLRRSARYLRRDWLKTLPPMMLSAPMVVSPPSTVALA